VFSTGSLRRRVKKKPLPSGARSGHFWPRQLCASVRAQRCFLRWSFAFAMNARSARQGVFAAQFPDQFSYILSYADVKARAAEIYEALANGSNALR
jgi:hypothetical protein